MTVPTDITVDTTTDAVDALPGDATCATGAGSCSLRAAVMESNRLPGVQVVHVPAGTYGFALPPAEGGFEPASGGDLDLTDHVVIQAEGTGAHVVDANALSRVFEVHPGTWAGIKGLTLRDGSDSSGGGVRVASGVLSLDHTTVASNQASVSGGGVTADGLGEVLNVVDSTIRDNVASFSGGGGIDAGGQLSVTDSVVRDNTSGGSGGGVDVGGTATITRSTIRDNETTGGLGNGGGISGNGLTIDRSTVSGNTAKTQGGGVFGTGTIVNSTLSGNATSTNGGGASTNGSLTLHNVTVAGNTAAVAGRGLHRFGSGSQLLVQNTILADPGGSECAGGLPTSQGHNIAGDATCALAAAGDLQSTDAQIAPLGFYGGPTRTHRLEPGSPALDAAAAIGLAVDQRGTARPIGPAPDIGAVEGTASFLSPSILASLLSLGPLVQGRLTVDLPRVIVPGDLLLVGVTTRNGQARRALGLERRSAHARSRSRAARALATRHGHGGTRAGPHPRPGRQGHRRRGADRGPGAPAADSRRGGVQGPGPGGHGRDQGAGGRARDRPAGVDGPARRHARHAAAGLDRAVGRRGRVGEGPGLGGERHRRRDREAAGHVRARAPGPLVARAAHGPGNVPLAGSCRVRPRERATLCVVTRAPLCRAAGLAAAVALLMVAGCGGSDDDRPSPDRRSAAERVVRGWSAALNRDDFGAAADYFARGALIQQTERFRLTSRRAALAFNRSLPCRGRVTKVRDEGETAVATFTLQPRPGAPPTACDTSVRVRFRARGGKFVEWRQLPEPAAPKGTPA